MIEEPDFRPIRFTPILHLYLIQELSQYMTDKEFKALSLVSRSFYVFITRSRPLLLRLDATNSLIGRIWYKNLPCLKTLILKDNYLDESSFDPILKLTRLRELDISNSAIALPVAWSLSRLYNLEVLDISQNYIHPQNLGFLTTLTKLTRLVLSSNLTLLGMSEEVFAKLSNLDSLNVSKNYLGVKIVNSLARLTRLTELDLSKCWIGDGDVSLTSLISLKSFNLRQCALKKTSIQLSSLTKLSSLNLADNSLGISGLTQLQIPHSVQYLILSDNTLMDSCLDQLTQLRNLRELHLQNNTISKEAVSRFKALKIMNRVAIILGQSSS